MKGNPTMSEVLGMWREAFPRQSDDLQRSFRLSLPQRAYLEGYIRFLRGEGAPPSRPEGMSELTRAWLEAIGDRLVHGRGRLPDLWL